MIYKVDQIKDFNDKRGSLCAVEFSNFPFVPKRMFYVTDVPKAVERGFHSHYKCKQYLICIQGQIEVTLNDGTGNVSFILNPNEAVLVENLIWDSQRFLTGNDILLVLASQRYIKKDYITDFEEFKKEKLKKMATIPIKELLFI